MRSLKHQLTWSVAGAVIVVAFVAGLTLYLLARAYLLDQFDGQLANKARLLASTVEVEDRKLELDFEDLDLSEFRSHDTGGYLQLWYQGRVAFRSPSLGGSDLAGDVASDDPAAARWVELPRGRLGRGVVYRFEPKMDPDSEPDSDTEPDPEVDSEPHTDPQPEDSPDTDAVHASGQQFAVLCIARDAGGLTGALTTLRLGLLTVGGVLALVATLVIQRVVARALRPVDALASKLGQLDANNLHQQVTTPPLPRELQPILDQFNQLAVRLHGAFERERTFSANIAHELRTPLAGLRATVEVALSKARSPQQYAQSLESLLVVVKQMHSLVEGLLQLAALDNGLGHPKFQTITLNGKIRELWDSAIHAKPPGKQISVELNLDPDDPPVTSDPALLSLIFRNVFHNAVTYVNDGGIVTVATERLPRGGLRVRVANSGSTVCPEDAAKVFDRFWRADQARAATGSRFGLGLALAHRAAEALGATISARSQKGGEFAVTLDLPARAKSTPSHDND